MSEATFFIPKVKPLQHNDLPITIGAPMTESASQRARLRLREEMARVNLNQSDIAGLLRWKQSRVSKLLNGHIELTVDDLAALCFALGIAITEAVRDHGLEFCAEMTPTELRILEGLRRASPAVLDVVKELIQFTVGSVERRSATPKKKLLGTPRR